MRMLVWLDIEKQPTNEVDDDGWKPRPIDVLKDLALYLERMSDDASYRYISVTHGSTTVYPQRIR